MNDDEFKELLKKYSHPDHLVRMAKTKWQKAVAIEFVNQDKKFLKIESEVIWIKRITMSIFAVVVIAAVAQYIGPALQTIFG